MSDILFGVCAVALVAVFAYLILSYHNDDYPNL